MAPPTDAEANIGSGVLRKSDTAVQKFEHMSAFRPPSVPPGGPEGGFPAGCEHPNAVGTLFAEE